MTARLEPVKMLADLGFKLCAPTATRTRDLLLRRHSRNAAWRRPVWLDVPLCNFGSGWMWPEVALDLWSLAPRLAPRNIVRDLMFECSSSDADVARPAWPAAGIC